MELTHEFIVSVPPDQAWAVLTDVERIAPHLPGAQLTEVDGEVYSGLVKIKVGPITAQYKGKASFKEKDATARRVVLQAEGRDARQGNAAATITAQMLEHPEGTKVELTTDLTISGKVAQFGRGVLADVSSKLIDQFVESLDADIQSEAAAPADVEPATSAEAPADTTSDAPTDTNPDAPTDTTADAPSDSASEEPSAPTAEPAAATAAPTGPRKITAPEAKPIDLLDAAGGSVVKRFAPIGAVVLVVLLLVLRARRRGSRR